jgi:DNA-binding NarL/FixJ family response regulator
MATISEQKEFEIVKALAYGESVQQIADAENVDEATVTEVAKNLAADIAEEQETLRKAGYLK